MILSMFFIKFIEDNIEYYDKENLIDEINEIDI